MAVANTYSITLKVALAAMTASFASSVLAVDDRTDLMQIEAKNFSHPLKVDNKWMPHKIGVQKTYEGYTLDDEDKRIPWKVVEIVTDLVKVVNGIETVIVWERDYKKNKLEESELAWRAQDNEGNVWHFGEVKEVYDENVKLVGAKVWMDGALGAKSGILMPGKPTKGAPSYSQGFAKGVYKWDDRGQVRNMGENVKTPGGTFSDVLVVEEWSREELAKGALQLKYYAPGVGYVSVGWEGNDPVKETLELTSVKQLSPQEMDVARAGALEVEERSYYYGRDTKPPYRRKQ